jgi:hypothetical protein
MNSVHIALVNPETTTALDSTPAAEAAGAVAQENAEDSV